MGAKITMKKKYLVWAVTDKNGRGYSMRHGAKETPSIYEHRRNAESFVYQALTKKAVSLRIVECIIHLSV